MQLLATGFYSAKQMFFDLRAFGTQPSTAAVRRGGRAAGGSFTPTWQRAVPRRAEEGADGCLAFSSPPHLPLGGSSEEAGSLSTAYACFVF